MAKRGGNNHKEVNIFEALAADSALQETITALKRRLGMEVSPPSPPEDIPELEYDPELLRGLALTQRNAARKLQDQRVNVEYLKPTERLQIPKALNMFPGKEGAPDFGGFQPLVTSYWNVEAMGYAALKTLVLNSKTYADIRTKVDNADRGEHGQQFAVCMRDSATYIDATGATDSEDQACKIYTRVSRALGFNCDIRDMGLVGTVALRMSDDYWMNLKDVTISRLDSKLHKYTLLCVAALNYTVVDSNFLAAWVRAYALSAGILPDVSSKYAVEYEFVAAHPPLQLIRDISAWEVKQMYHVRSICLNLIAVFGLLHLAKDCTYKLADNEVMRISTLYLMALRTMVPDDDMDMIMGKAEIFCRTAQHPFGLAQTYAVAQIMGNHTRLSKPLSIRTGVTPPSLRRLMLVKAATNEWTNFHVGVELNAIHQEELAVVNAEIEKINKLPPAYSELSRLYGFDKTKIISEKSVNAVDVMMPLVYGFAMSWHCDGHNNKDGIALEMSLGDVSPDRRFLAKKFKTMWDKDNIVGYLPL